MVTTSSTRQTRSPGSKTPSSRFDGAVVLRFLADDQEGQAALERRRGGERDGSELRPGEPDRVRLVLAHGVGDRAAERREQVGAGLEPVLVEVVLRAAAGAEDEVAFEVGGVAERAGELVPRHDAASRSCAIGRRRSASGDPSVKECIEPSEA